MHPLDHLFPFKVKLPALILLALSRLEPRGSGSGATSFTRAEEPMCRSAHPIWAAVASLDSRALVLRVGVVWSIPQM